MITKPLVAIFEIYESCNYNCTFCGNLESSANTKKTKEVDDKTVLDVAKKIGENEIFFANISGGEILLNPERLLKVLDELNKHNVYSSLSTNLSLATPEILQDIKKRGVNSALISFHNYKREKFAKTVRNKKAFDLVNKNIEMAMNEGFNISPNMVLTRNTVDDLLPTAEYLIKNFGIKQFSATPIAASTKKHADLLITPSQLEQVLDAIIYLNEEKNVFTRMLRSFPYCSVKNTEKYAHILDVACAAGKNMVAISPNGDVRYCSHSGKVYGNILDKNIEDITDKMTDEGILPEYCLPCKYVKECRSGCIAETEVLNDKNIYHLYVDEVNKNDSFNPQVNIQDLTTKQISLPNNIVYRKERDDTFTLISNPFHINLDESEFNLFSLMKASNKNTFQAEKFIKEYNLDTNYVNNFLNKLKYNGMIPSMISEVVK